jgi:hypothetical protein
MNKTGAEISALRSVRLRGGRSLAKTAVPAVINAVTGALITVRPRAREAPRARIRSARLGDDCPQVAGLRGRLEKLHSGLAGQ